LLLLIILRGRRLVVLRRRLLLHTLIYYPPYDAIDNSALRKYRSRKSKNAQRQGCNNQQPIFRLNQTRTFRKTILPWFSDILMGAEKEHRCRLQAGGHNGSKFVGMLPQSADRV
jgi:hypothetical protein